MSPDVMRFLASTFPSSPPPLSDGHDGPWPVRLSSPFLSSTLDRPSAEILSLPARDPSGNFPCLGGSSFPHGMNPFYRPFSSIPLGPLHYSLHKGYYVCLPLVDSLLSTISPLALLWPGLTAHQSYPLSLFFPFISLFLVRRIRFCESEPRKSNPSLRGGRFVYPFLALPYLYGRSRPILILFLTFSPNGCGAPRSFRLLRSSPESGGDRYCALFLRVFQENLPTLFFPRRFSACLEGFCCPPNIGTAAWYYELRF